MVVSVLRTQVTGVPGATSGGGISAAAAESISGLLSDSISNPPDRNTPLQVDEIAAGLSNMNGGALASKNINSTDIEAARTAGGKKENTTSVGF